MFIWLLHCSIQKSVGHDREEEKAGGIGRPTGQEICKRTKVCIPPPSIPSCLTVSVRLSGFFLSWVAHNFTLDLFETFQRDNLLEAPERVPE